MIEQRDQILPQRSRYAGAQQCIHQDVTLTGEGIELSIRLVFCSLHDGDAHLSDRVQVGVGGP